MQTRTAPMAPRPRAPGLFTVLDVGRNPVERPSAYFERFGDSFRTTLFGIPLLATRDPAVFEEVLVRQHKLFIKDHLTRGLSKLVGQGLLTSEGSEWKSHRRILQPHFQPGELTAYLPAFREEAERVMSSWVPGRAFELHAMMARLSMRIALRTVFGAAPDEFGDFETSMRAAMVYFAGVMGTAMPLPLSIPTPTNRRFLHARAHLNEALRTIINQARARGAGNSVLHSLLTAEEGGELSEQQLLDEGLTMLLAGHETSALALTYTLTLLAEAAHEQDAIREELGSEVPSTLHALRAPSRLARALKESMRLYPEAWALGRQARQDCEIAGYSVERGSQIYLYQWAAHRHPRWFENAESFLPDRWTPEFEASLPRLLYSPFGGGPRVCIGSHFALAEVLTALAVFLRRFRFELVGPFTRRFIPSITLRPRDPIPILVR